MKSIKREWNSINLFPQNCINLLSFSCSITCCLQIKQHFQVDRFPLNYTILATYSLHQWKHAATPECPFVSKKIVYNNLRHNHWKLCFSTYLVHRVIKLDNWDFFFFNITVDKVIYRLSYSQTPTVLLPKTLNCLSNCVLLDLFFVIQLPSDCVQDKCIWFTQYLDAPRS